jgi:hypothetical protein
MLVAGGASLTLADHHGNTPRSLAIHAEDLELAAYLESKSIVIINLVLGDLVASSLFAIFICNHRVFSILYLFPVNIGT